VKGLIHLFLNYVGDLLLKYAIRFQKVNSSVSREMIIYLEKDRAVAYILRSNLTTKRGKNKGNVVLVPNS
jgi:hypothetical protein